MKALAAGTEEYITATIDYKPGSSNQVTNGHFYSKAGSVYGYLNVPSGSGGIPVGKTITKIEYKGIPITPSGVVGQTSLTDAEITVTGNQLNVESKNNEEGTKGYYAWFRYLPNDPHKLNWYADVTGGDGITHRINCGPSEGVSDGIHKTVIGGLTDDINGYAMPQVPGCSSSDPEFTEMQQLGLDAIIDQAYKDNSNVRIPYEAVVPDASSATAVVNTTPSILGPTGYGNARASTILQSSISVKPNSSDASKFRILFDQHFTDYSDGVDSEQELANPPSGAKIRVWFAAFIATIKGKTYEYDNSVKIYYDTPPNAPNLGNISMAIPACVEVNQSTSFPFSFTNSGGSDITTPFDLKVLIDGSTYQTYHYNSMGATSSKTETITKSFGGTSTYSISILLDIMSDETDKTDNSKAFTVTPQASCTETPPPAGPEVITGTLSVRIPSIEFGTEIEYIDMSNISVSGGAGCQLATGIMYFTQGSVKWPHNLGQSGNFTDQFMPTTYNGIGAGSVSVQYDIITTCGTKKTIGPGIFNVTINSGIAPPVFQAAWFDSPFYSGYNTQITMIPIGEKISFGLVRKPSTPGNPGTPYDPNGAAVMYTTDINTNPDPWINRLYAVRGYDIHDDHFDNVLADVKGMHTITMSAMDDMGAVASPQRVTIDVVDPNPIPIITLPPKVIEGRPYTPDISCANSYSPYRARTITNCDWHGTKKTVYPTAGNYDIQLDVTDNVGLSSLFTAHANLTVQPDLPPVVNGILPSIGLRNMPMSMNSTAASPDNDVIVQHTTKIVCDTNINGDFSDETPMTMSPDNAGNFTFSPTVLAACKLQIYAKEDWGKDDYKEYSFTVANQQPTVAIDVKGDMPQPPAISGTTYDLASILSNTSQFKIEDAEGTSHLTDMYYDANEKALAVPYRSSQLYMAPTPDAYSLTTTNYSDSPCPRDGDGYSYCFSPMGERAGDNLYWEVGATTLWQCTWGCYHTPVETLYFFNANSNSYKTYHLNNSNDAHQYFSSPANDLFWIRTYPTWQNPYYYNPGTGYHDDIYRISDLAAGVFSPISSTPYNASSWQYYGQYSSYRTPIAPPPAAWIPEVQIPKLEKPVPYTLDINGTKSVEPTALNSFSDKDGNFYALGCNVQAVPQYTETEHQYLGTSNYYNCGLQKLSANGTVLWETPRNYKNYAGNDPNNSIVSRQYPSVNVNYVSEDGSKTYFTYYNADNGTNGVALYDSRTGTIANVSAPDPNKVYRDNYATSYQMVRPNTCSYDDSGNPQNCSYDKYVKITNLSNGNVIFDSASTGQPGGEPTVTADGKLVLGTRVYNMLDGQFLYTVAAPPTGFTSSILTGDGIGMYYSNACGNYGCINSIRGFKTSLPSSFADGGFTSGNIINKSKDVTNGSLHLSVKYASNYYGEYRGAGIVFREQDNKNFYQAAVTPKGAVLYKVVNGVKTVLSKQTNPQSAGKYIDLKVRMRGDHIVVYENGLPLVDVHDSTFTTGKQGIYSEAPNVYLKKYYIEESLSNNLEIDGVAIVNTAIRYNVNFTDPDNDPAIPDLGTWTYTNTAPEKFLDAGDGASDTSATNSYVDRIVSSPILSLNKVGIFKVTFTEPDDPAPLGKRYPDNTYASFRQYADPDTKLVAVHRAPISLFTVSQNADFTLSWTEMGYDPDRWLSSSSYSNEKAEYATNRGIYQNLYGYSDPDGNVFSGKLVRPQKQGTYTLREAVADEYGAWSNWYEVEYYVDISPLNNPPAAVLTFPNGTKTNPSYVNSLTPAISWNQSDPDIGTVFTQARIWMKDMDGNTIIDRVVAQNTISLTAQWTLDTALQMGQEYELQVMIADDGGAWSSWSNSGWLLTNRPPVATMAVPNGPQTAPTIFSNVRPNLQWSQTDPDPGTTFQYFQIQVTNEANDAIILDSGPYYEGSTSSTGNWTVNMDLPTGQKLRVRVRVFDGYVWSEYSPQTWMYINRAPIAEFDWTPKPVWEGDIVQTSNTSSDPDGDVLSYEWKLEQPDATIITFSSKDFAHRFLEPGVYKVTLTVSDGFLSNTIVKMIAAMPLTIQSDVTYTDNWLLLHEKSGHQTTAVPKDFYSGEIFIVTSRSSPAPVDEVTAWIDTIGLDGHSLYVSEPLVATVGDAASFSGELFDAKFQSFAEGLPLGLQTIHFKIRYRNGVVKTEDIPVRIIGNVNKSVGVHRVQ